MSEYEDLTDEEMAAEAMKQLFARNGETSAYDPEFEEGLIRAAHAFIVAKGKDPKVEGARLALYLLSDKPLDRGQRKYLAMFALGIWRRRAGRTPVGSQKKNGDCGAFGRLGFGRMAQGSSQNEIVGGHWSKRPDN